VLRGARSKSTLVRLLRLGLAVAALAFVAYTGVELARRWNGAELELSVAPAAASLFPLALGAVILAWGWARLLETMAGRRIGMAFAIALNLESQLARYMPGKVGVPLVRMTGAPRLGVSPRTVGSSVVVELLSFLAVGGLFSFAALRLGSAHAQGGVALLGRWGTPLIALFLVVTIALVTIDRHRLPGFVLRALGLTGRGPLVPPVLLIVHLGYWITQAAHGYLATRALGASSVVAASSVGLFSLAPIVGFLALAAPGGLGVREAVLAIGLSPSLGSAAALAIAILSRAAMLVSDVAVWLGSRPFANKR
jgi:hypothetical protein